MQKAEDRTPTRSLCSAEHAVRAVHAVRQRQAQCQQGRQLRLQLHKKHCPVLKAENSGLRGARRRVML